MISILLLTQLRLTQHLPSKPGTAICGGVIEEMRFCVIVQITAYKTARLVFAHSDFLLRPI